MLKYLGKLQRAGLTSKHQASDADVRYATADHAGPVCVQGAIHIAPALAWSNTHHGSIVTHCDLVEL